MIEQVEASDPLILAIHELRTEFVQWIDTELDRLREHAAIGNRADRAAAAAASSYQFRELPATTTTAAATVRRESYSARPGPSEISPPASALAGRVERDQAVKPLRSMPEPPDESRAQVERSDPRKRLDALARMLDHRLKQVQGEAAADAAEKEMPNRGVAGETPRRP